MTIINIGSYVSPLNQFEAGETAYACVAFGCADIFYSGPTGGTPTGTAEQIDLLADLWYTKFTGSLQSTSGLSAEQEYEMLAGIGLHYRAIGANVAEVKQWLGWGYPVLICGVEAGFFDVGLGRIPYGWTPAGNHCIVACGIAANGNLLVRDYANIPEVPGSLREYASPAMSLVSATAVTPRWKTPFVTPIAPPLPPPPLPNPHQRQAFEKEWTAIVPDAMLTSGIANAAWDDYQAGNFHGPALTKEYSGENWEGKPITIQNVAGGRYEWTGEAHYYSYV